MNSLNGHVIGESKRHGVWTLQRARRILASDRVKQNGNINRLYSNATSIINDADIGEWVNGTFTLQQLLVEILDYYQNVRDAGRGTTIRGVINHFKKLRARHAEVCRDVARANDALSAATAEDDLSDTATRRHEIGIGDP